METKYCPGCQSTKPASDFYQNQTRADNLGSYCKTCARDASVKSSRKHPQTHKRAAKKYRDNNPGNVRDQILRYRYGISIGEYDAMLARQGGGCAICGKATARKRQTRLHVDHCKETKKVRGLLCAACNNGLGQFDHDTDLMNEAIGYIVRNTD